MPFHLGQKIICVNDKWLAPFGLVPPILPKKGAVYHFAGVDVAPGKLGGYLFVAEIPKEQNIPPFFSVTVGYGAWHFRPLDERQTDISVFQKLILPVKSKERIREDA
jgi:hypothetical protein